MKTIFLIDDSHTILMSMEQLLSRHSVKIEKASDGEEAMRKLKAGLKPDLIITDINMPRKDGMQLIREVKQDPRFRFTPILVLTTEFDATKKTEAKKLGATGWLVKPVNGEQLLAVLKQVLPGAVA
ncbi:response regulator [Marinobacter sediminum]|uniref:response regulator n=1 Tax=Marinobacter sediminum TaxID=256323 RepID=UPI00356ABF01